MSSAHEQNSILNEQIESLAKMGTWSLDLKTYQLSWSDGVFKMLGYEPQEFDLTHEKGLEIIYPVDRELAGQLMEQTINTGKDYSAKKKANLKRWQYCTCSIYRSIKF